MSSSSSPIELFDPGGCLVGFVRQAPLRYAVDPSLVSSGFTSTMMLPIDSKKKNPSPILHGLSFLTLYMPLLFFNSSVIPYLWFIASLGAFYFYANSGFRTLK